MYYLATISNDGIERACDFGFDIVERILLDEGFKALQKTPAGLVREKRFCVYDNCINLKQNQILGASAEQICGRLGLYVGYDNCFATVLDGSLLKVFLERAWMKIYNKEEWRCSKGPTDNPLFNSVVVYDPYAMRQMLSEEKYGSWDHSKDREMCLKVLSKFIDFLQNAGAPNALILYNEIFCSRWDAIGELHFNTEGKVTGFRYFGEGKAFSYVYTPKVDTWCRA